VTDGRAQRGFFEWAGRQARRGAGGAHALLRGWGASSARGAASMEAPGVCSWRGWWWCHGGRWRVGASSKEVLTAECVVAAGDGVRGASMAGVATAGAREVGLGQDAPPRSV
jgi:hypothetical protein